jgi:hypothetical protein
MKVNTAFEASSTSGRIKNCFTSKHRFNNIRFRIKGKGIYKDACKPLSKVTFRMNVNGKFLIMIAKGSSYTMLH